MISAFTCLLSPERWQFPYLESITSWLDFADEIVVVDGGSTDGSLEKIQALSSKIRIEYLKWPWEYTQHEYPKHLNFGLDHCRGDWIFKFDIDYLLHETEIAELKNNLKDIDDKWVVAMPKYTVMNRSQGFVKGELNVGVNRKHFDKVRFGKRLNTEKDDWGQLVDIQGDVNCVDTDGIPYGLVIPRSHVHRTGVKIWNYDSFFRTRENCKTWFFRVAKAMKDTDMAIHGSNDEEAWKCWFDSKERFRNFASALYKDHPKYIKERIEHMLPWAWGYENWNWKI